MCNFVPGEVVAFGRRKYLEVPEIEEVGEATVIPILPDDLNLEENAFREYSFLHLTGIREGCEVAVISKVSAFLSSQIRKKQAVVELNYTLSPAVARPRTNADTPEFSLETKQWIAQIRNHYFDAKEHKKRPVAIIDSGVDTDHLSRRRTVETLGFKTVNSLKDNRSHGTIVARILDEALPGDVPLVCGKIADKNRDITVMKVSQLFAQIIATWDPAIVNLSLSPYNDTADCPKCRNTFPIEAFHSYIFRHVLELAPRTLTVMAAGNSSSYCNDTLLDKRLSNIIYAVATGSNGRVTGYSSEPSNSASALYAFGGDDKCQESGSGVLENNREIVGTSFSAPLISSALYPLVIRMNGQIDSSDIMYHPSVRYLLDRYRQPY